MAVVKDNSVYQKVLRVYGLLLRAIDGRMSKHDIASDFQEDTAYDEGRLVIHDDKLYRCVQYFSGGEWPNPNPYFVESTIDDALQNIRPHTSGDIYAKDEDGKFHKIVIEKSGNQYTLAVDQEPLTEDEIS